MSLFRTILFRTNVRYSSSFPELDASSCGRLEAAGALGDDNLDDDDDVDGGVGGEDVPPAAG